MRFSVIIPLYNKAPYVRRALESVIAQTFRDFELIVVDDGSNDGAYDVARETLAGEGMEIHRYAQNDKNGENVKNDQNDKEAMDGRGGQDDRSRQKIDCRIIRQENSGVSTARNNGVAASHGDYLCFLDADDWWAPEFLEKMDAIIREYPDAGIYGTNYYYVKNGRQRLCVTTAETGYINYCRVYAEKLQMPLWTGAACVPRRIFDDMGGFRPHLKLGEDFDLWIKIALEYNVAFLNEPLSYYFQDSDTNWRLVGKLHNPSEHMLWNLNYLADEEKTNPDYKRLIDRLRTYSLLPYYLSEKYRKAARQELDKVDWSSQPDKVRRLYRMPVPVLKIRQAVLKCGSHVKQWLIRQKFAPQCKY